MDTSSTIVSLDATATQQLATLDSDADLLTYGTGVNSALLFLILLALLAIAIILATDKGRK